MNDGLFALTSQYVIQSGILNVKGKHFLFFFEMRYQYHVFKDDCIQGDNHFTVPSRKGR